MGINWNGGGLFDRILIIGMLLLIGYVIWIGVTDVAPAVLASLGGV